MLLPAGIIRRVAGTPGGLTARMAVGENLSALISSAGNVPNWRSGLEVRRDTLKFLASTIIARSLNEAPCFCSRSGVTGTSLQVAGSLPGSPTEAHNSRKGQTGRIRPPSRNGRVGGSPGSIVVSPKVRGFGDWTQR